MAAEPGQLPLGLRNYIKNLLNPTSCDGKHLIGCGDNKALFCPWLSVSRVTLSSNTEAAERLGAVIVVHLCCRDPSATRQLQPVSLHDTWRAQGMHA